MSEESQEFDREFRRDVEVRKQEDERIEKIK